MKAFVYPPKTGKGNCLGAQVPACDKWVKRTLGYAGAAISFKKASLLHFTRNDNSLNGDLGLRF
jgi:hypothetical protein